MGVVVRCLLVAAMWLMSLPGLASAQNRVHEVEAQGSGTTREEAITSALAHAVAQVNGASVDLDTRTRTTELQAVRSSPTDGSVEAYDASIKQSVSAGFRAAGQVESYTVLSASRLEGAHVARVLARVIRYEVPTTTQLRRRVAITPVQISGSSHDYYGRISSAALADEIGAHLESALNGHRRFALLDRTQLGLSLDELRLIGSDLTEAAEKAKLKRIQGADYLLIPSVRSVRATGPKVDPLTGQDRSGSDLDLQLRVVIPRHLEVRFSKVYSASRARSRSGALDGLADAAVTDLVERIYVPRVVEVMGANGAFVVDIGDGAAAVGERFEIRAAGKRLESAYTGESLGAVGGRVGVAEVTQVYPKMSYLQLVEGEPSTVEKGMYAYRVSGSSASGALAAPREERGVVLPQDQGGGGWAP